MKPRPLFFLCVFIIEVSHLPPRRELCPPVTSLSFAIIGSHKVFNKTPCVLQSASHGRDVSEANKGIYLAGMSSWGKCRRIYPATSTSEFLGNCVYFVLPCVLLFLFVFLFVRFHLIRVVNFTISSINRLCVYSFAFLGLYKTQVDSSVIGIGKT